jgi:NOL1/NOP2/fmu family ribosome biogenesis protein
MEKELYHIDEVKHALRKLNPHLEFREYRKNQSNFSVDFILTLAEHQTKVEVPMDLFRDYDRGGKEQVEERLQQGYVLLLRKLEEK